MSGTEGAGATPIRQQLFDLYLAGIRAVAGDRVVARNLRADPLEGPVRLVAIGKAAAAMARGAASVLGPRVLDALVITKAGHCGEVPFPCLEGGHPLPDAGSLAAGRHLLQFVAGNAGDAHYLILLSGGASALVEAVPAPLGIEELVRVNDWLLASGLPITQMNQIRKRLSLVKGGRLAALLRGHPVRQLLISDVPGDRPDVIGSGPLAPDRQAGEPLAPVPAWMEPWLNLAPPAPEAGSDCFEHIQTRIVARLADAMDAAATMGMQSGFPVTVHPEFLAGPADVAGRRLAAALVGGPPGLHIWGGETTVMLPEQPGAGGRNQHLALAAAVELQGRHGCCLLAAGTDGTDGPTDDAGALVDGGTIGRGRGAGLDEYASLKAADSGRFLAAAGDLVRTGPTGTNVMDIVLGIKFNG